MGKRRKLLNNKGEGLLIVSSDGMHALFNRTDEEMSFAIQHPVSGKQSVERVVLLTSTGYGHRGGVMGSQSSPRRGTKVHCHGRGLARSRKQGYQGNTTRSARRLEAYVAGSSAHMDLTRCKSGPVG